VVALAVTLAVLTSVRFLASDATSVRVPGPITGHLAAVSSERPGLRVLFVGNSFTYANEMPRMVEKLSEQDRGARRLFSAEYAPAGSQLVMAARDVRLRKAIADERWDAVVLQEQSQIPSWAGYREAHMFPAAEALARMARQRGAQTVLYMTWGYREGDRGTYPGDSYEAMQARLASGYTELSLRLHAPVAAVGLAWQTALRKRPEIPFWAPDGRHPSQAGSYLAACVLYARLAHRDPRRSRYTAGLGRAEARGLQRIAAAQVLRPSTGNGGRRR
jgi:hypothetical protein